MLILGELEKSWYCAYHLYIELFLLSQDDKVVPSTDVEGVLASNIEQSFQESLAKKRLFLCIYNKYQGKIEYYVSLLNIGFAITIKQSMFVLSTHLPYIFPSSDKIIFRLPHGG